MALKIYLKGRCLKDIDPHPRLRGHSENCACEDCTGNTNNRGSDLVTDKATEKEEVSV